jgi:hypothetical protein
MSKRKLVESRKSFDNDDESKDLNFRKQKSITGTLQNEIKDEIIKREPSPDVKPNPNLRDEIEDAILKLANKRGLSKSYCPSEIPRLALNRSNWRELMDLTREVAFIMAKAGTVVILQKNVVVKESDLPVKGIMRIRLART